MKPSIYILTDIRQVFEDDSGILEVLCVFGGLSRRFQNCEAKAHDFSREMKPTTGENLIVPAFVGCDTESEVRMRTPPWQ